MSIVLQEARRLLFAREPFVLATVVDTKGSTPQKAGARLVVRSDGSIVGTLGGGCVEADVRIEARAMLSSGDRDASTRRFRLTEDIALKDGLVCGGRMDIVIEPLRDRLDFVPVLDEVLAALDGGASCAFALRFDAASPGRPGAGAREKGREVVRSLIRADRSVAPSLGDAEIDVRSAELAVELMPRGKSAYVDVDDGSRIWVEAFTRPATIVIAGGGHVGKAVYTLARFLGFRVVIVDDRPEFANTTRFPEARCVVDDFDRGLCSLSLGPNDHVLIATRGHKLDDVALTEAARSNAGWVGLLGSKRKAVLVFRELHRAGVPESRIREIRSPVGLDIGGRQPEEIALSILAEIVAFRSGAGGAPMGMMDDALLAKVRSAAARSESGESGESRLRVDDGPAA